MVKNISLGELLLLTMNVDLNLLVQKLVSKNENHIDTFNINLYLNSFGTKKQKDYREKPLTNKCIARF